MSDLGVIKENQGEYDVIHFVYAQEDVTGVPKLCEPEKCERWEWLSPGEIDERMVRGHLLALEMHHEGKSCIDWVGVEK